MFIARSVESGLGMALNSGSVQPWCVDTTVLMKRPSDITASTGRCFEQSDYAILRIVKAYAPVCA
jgi:hypothetical protein